MSQNAVHPARLRFLYSAMGGGKSTALLQDVYNIRSQNKRVLLIKPDRDKKGESHIQSRIGYSQKVDFLARPDTNLYQLIQSSRQAAMSLQHVFVDEAQFLTPQQVDELLEVATLLGIPVSCYGLRSDFRTNGFPGSIRLFELAHEVINMPSLNPCRSCGQQKAEFNARKQAGHYTIIGNQVAIDGLDAQYEALCAACYMQHTGRLSSRHTTREQPIPSPFVAD